MHSDSPHDDKRFYGGAYQKGAELIKDYVQNLPEKSGIYQMWGENDKLLYVGKARSLKARVISYTRPTGLNNRIMRMVSQTHSMTFEITATESEALLLEADLIKNLKPHFNILLRDDKSYPYIMVRKDHAYPQILQHRGIKAKDGKYFGPFASAKTVYQTLDVLQKAFLLRTCTDNVFENRSRPCLLYQIKRCSAPCTGEISHPDYLESVKTAEKFLSGGGKAIFKDLSDKMYAESDAMNFEKAAHYRDRIKALSVITNHSGFHPETFSEADVVALHKEGDMVCVQISFYRAAQNWGTHAYFPNISADMSEQDIMDGFLGQFYQNKPAPPLIILSHTLPNKDVLQEALGRRYDTKVMIDIPQKGERFTIINNVLQNAKESLARKKAEKGTQKALLDGLAEVLGLSSPIERIEVYDNAHISGSHAVGAMIVATPEGLQKKDYRTWKIKNTELSAGDDYGMMREVLSRRFKRLGEEALEKPETIPDLIILDGGQGQLSTVMSVAVEYGIDIPIIAVAKGEDRNAGHERFFMAGKAPFQLSFTDPILYFVQRLRDEAHRFANGTHSKKRDKSLEKSLLDDIEGIGSSRRKALIAKFGSARAVSEASLEEILKTPSISEAMAKKIFEHFSKK